MGHGRPDRAFLPVLLERPEGHIVNTSSMGGFIPVPGQTIYGATKAAVKLFTEGLNAECAGPGPRDGRDPGRHGDEHAGELGRDDRAPCGADVEKLAKNLTTPQQAANEILDGMEKNASAYHRPRREADGPALPGEPGGAAGFIARQMRSLLPG